MFETTPKDYWEERFGDANRHDLSRDVYDIKYS